MWRQVHRQQPDLHEVGFFFAAVFLPGAAWAYGTVLVLALSGGRSMLEFVGAQWSTHWEWIGPRSAGDPAIAPSGPPARTVPLTRPATLTRPEDLTRPETVQPARRKHVNVPTAKAIRSPVASSTRPRRAPGAADRGLDLRADDER